MITAIAIVIMLLYLFIIGWLTYGFDKVDDFNLKNLEAKTQFSVVIPFRNEAKNLPNLLASISELNYPKSMFEIILVDDGSEDNSVEIIKTVLNAKPSKKGSLSSYNVKIIPNERHTNSPKKDAITKAISISQHNWIITTDADCILPKYWLDAYDECIQSKNVNCIVAPVSYHLTDSFFFRFQTLDFLSLQGSTIGGFGIKQPFMCNGANFGYKKSMFNYLNGFKGNTNISSGDDIFLLEKFVKNTIKKVCYLKSNKAIVNTKPNKSFSGLIQQRLRWASKTSHYNSRFAKLVGLLVLLGNLTAILLIPLVFFNLLQPRIAIALFAIKFSIDFLLLFKTTRFFKQETILFSYIFSSLLYPFLCVYITLLSLFKSYEWKGRTFKK